MDPNTENLKEQHRVDYCLINNPFRVYLEIWASQVALVVKNPTAKAGDLGLIPGSGRFPGGVYIMFSHGLLLHA